MCLDSKLIKHLLNLNFWLFIPAKKRNSSSEQKSFSHAQFYLWSVLSFSNHSTKRVFSKSFFAQSYFYTVFTLMSTYTFLQFHEIYWQELCNRKDFLKPRFQKSRCILPSLCLRHSLISASGIPGTPNCFHCDKKVTTVFRFSRYFFHSSQSTILKLCHQSSNIM